RIDHANHVLGLRLNDWTSIGVFLAALVAFVVSARLHPGREESVYLPGHEPAEPEPSSPTRP
ncbi:MAG: prolipoprotein diacylglyceryl transferase, partial [Nocardioidaceae bacterium]